MFNCWLKQTRRRVVTVPLYTDEGQEFMLHNQVILRPCDIVHQRVTQSFPLNLILWGIGFQEYGCYSLRMSSSCGAGGIWNKSKHKENDNENWDGFHHNLYGHAIGDALDVAAGSDTIGSGL